MPHIILGMGFLELFWANALFRHESPYWKAVGVFLSISGVWDVIDALVKLEILP